MKPCKIRKKNFCHIADKVWTKEKGTGGIRHVDEIKIKIESRLCCFYRKIDEYGNLVDVQLSKPQEREGTKTLFSQALELHDDPVQKMVTGGLASYPQTLEKELGKSAEYEVCPCLAISLNRVID